MTAAKTPAASRPAITSGACRSMRRTRIELAAGPLRSGKSRRPETPRTTLGTQTAAMHSG